MRTPTRMMLTVTLAVSLSGCQTLSKTTEQCSPVFVYVDESKKLIDVDKSYCSVRQYEFDINHVGPIPGTTAKKSLPYCDRCVGFKKYASVATFWEKVRRELSSGSKNYEAKSQN